MGVIVPCSRGDNFQKYTIVLYKQYIDRGKGKLTLPWQHL